MPDSVKDLPKGWVELYLENVAEIRAGYGFPMIYQGKSKGDYPFAKVGDISINVLKGNNEIISAKNYVDEIDLIKLKAKPIPKNSVIFAKIGEAIRLNRRVLTGCEMLIDNNVMSLIPDHRILYHYSDT